MNRRRETLQKVIIVALGGALGTALRIGVQSASFAMNVEAAILAAINIAGSVALGYVLVAPRMRAPRRQLFLATGVLGGFTTYSAFTYDAFTGFSQGAVTETLLFVGISLIGGICGALLGSRLGRRA